MCVAAHNGTGKATCEDEANKIAKSFRQTRRCDRVCKQNAYGENEEKDTVTEFIQQFTTVEEEKKKKKTCLRLFHPWW